MGRGILPTIKHPTHFKIIISLSQEDNSSYGISKLLNKSQSNIYEQMRKLEDEKFIVPTEKNSFILNKDKIKNIYLDKFYTLEIKNELPKKEKIIKNKYFNLIFEDSLKLLYESINAIDEKTTLNDYFIYLSRFISSTKYPIIPTTSQNLTYGIMNKYNIKNPNDKKVILILHKWFNFIGTKDNEYRDYHQFALKSGRLLTLMDKIDYDISNSFEEYFDEQTKDFQKEFIDNN